MLTSTVIICTRNRPGDVETALRAIARTAYTGQVILMDASDPVASERVSQVAANVSGINCQYVVAPRKGLARQRNDALDRFLNDCEIVHFIDDDTVVEEDYFRSIESRFRSDDAIAGVGAVILDQPPQRLLGIKSFFMLYSRHPGRVLKSGRNTIGHYVGVTSEIRNVDWLPGCCMSYRTSSIHGYRFDDRLEGYSWGEDFDFSFRVSRQHVLLIDPQARCEHRLSSVNRSGARPLARERTLLLQRWVRENRPLGMSSLAFWWSVFGEFILRGMNAMRHRPSRDTALGIVDAVRLGFLRDTRRRTEKSI